MREILKFVFEFIKKHLNEMENDSRIVRVASRYSRATTSEVKRLVIRYPISVLFLVALCGLTYVYFNPTLLGRDKCYLASIDYDDFHKSGAVRNCQRGHVVALAWDSFQGRQDANKGSLLVMDEILDLTEHIKSRWDEIYIPTIKPPKGPLYVHHRWTLSSESRHLDLQTGICASGNEPSPDGKERIVKSHVGFTLLSEPRTGNPNLSEQEERECNNLDLLNPKFQDKCKPVLLEIFVPSEQPVHFCQSKTTMERWTGAWMWAVGHRPYLCLRTIQTGGQQSDWRPLGIISKVWCD